MIISRRKYERDLKEAAEKAAREVEERFWQRDQMNGLQEQINQLRKQLFEVKQKVEPQQGSDEKNEAAVPLFFE